MESSVYDERTLHEIARMPFIPTPPISLEIGKMERVVDIARKNGIHWRKCLQILYRLDRDPNFKLTWLDTPDGNTHVCVDLNI